MSEVVIRTLEEKDAGAVLAGQRKAFSVVFGMLLTKPHAGVVAELDGRIVGAATTKLVSTPKGLAGYLDIGHVDASQRGKSLGTQLYTAAIDQMRGQGAVAVTATIRDDNRRSWKIMERNGCSITTFPDLVGKFGLSGALRIGLHSHLTYALGHELWVSGELRQERSLSVFAGILLIDCLLFLLASRGNLYFSLGAVILPVFEILLARLALVGTNAAWNLQRPHAGLPLSVFVSLTGGLLPVCASWQPVGDGLPHDARKKYLGQSSALAWLGTILVTSASFLVVAAGRDEGLIGQVLSGIINTGFMILAYRTLAVFPFESYGGRRVWDWKKLVFALLSIASIAVIAWIVAY